VPGSFARSPYDLQTTSRVLGIRQQLRNHCLPLTDVSFRWHLRNSELGKGLRRAFGLESVESMLLVEQNGTPSLATDVIGLGRMVGYSAVTLWLTTPVNREAEVRLAS
jgi:hypothetical protein